MTDLVKRLQYQAGCKDPDLHKADVDLLWQAADRIEELEAKVERVSQLPARWRDGEFEAMSPDCDFIEDLCADQLEKALNND